MKISVGDHGQITIEKVYPFQNPVMFRTAEGFEILVCMRGEDYEIGIQDTVPAEAKEDEKTFSWHRIKRGSVIKTQNALERLGAFISQQRTTQQRNVVEKFGVEIAQDDMTSAENDLQTVKEALLWEGDS